MTVAEIVNNAMPPLVVALVVGWAKAYRDQGVLQSQVGILWKMMETQALGALHHDTQPGMDAMLEGFAKGTLDMDQLRQFMQRLEVISSGGSNAPEQIPAANLILQSAREQYKTRKAHPTVIGGAEQALRDESDRRMAERTAEESRHNPASIFAKAEKADPPPGASTPTTIVTVVTHPMEVQTIEVPRVPPPAVEVQTIEVTGAVVPPREPAEGEGR